MYKTNVLIISKRKELSIKYKKLIEGLEQNAIITSDLSLALSIIQKQDIEFIIISDTIKEKLSDFIAKIRILTYNSRPIIIAVSKSSDLEDKIEALDKGADDFWGEEISKKEFQMRFKAHLRRYLESSLENSSGVLNKNFTFKAIKRSFDLSNISYLLVKIENIETYKKTHGEIASQKVLQTLSAIINSTSAKDDFIGHISEHDFILITNTLLAEKMAQFLTFAFDNIVNKFYSNDEFENEFVISTNENVKELKEGLMKLNIAVIKKDGNVENIETLINSLFELIKLCDNSKNSTYVVDRIKLKGETKPFEKRNRVLIMEPDSALSCLLKNVCELNDFKVKTAQNKNDFYSIYKEFSPNVVILDWGSKEETTALEIAKVISKDEIKLIFTSSYLNKKEILKAGADLYIPKPYEINDILDWIKKFLD